MAVNLTYLTDRYTPYFGYLIILFFLCFTLYNLADVPFTSFCRLGEYKPGLRGPKRFKVFYDQDLRYNFIEGFTHFYWIRLKKTLVHKIRCIQMFVNKFVFLLIMVPHECFMLGQSCDWEISINCTAT